MSCAQRANTVAKFISQAGGGITRLSNKRVFYGAVLGASGSGLVALAAYALNRRRAGQGSRLEKPQGLPLQSKPIPELAARKKVTPVSSGRISPTTRCQECEAVATGKKGAWYAIKGQYYCGDCAPGAARQVDVDLVAPSVAPSAGNAWTRSEQPTGQTTTDSRRRSTAESRATYLPLDKSVETHPAESRLKVYVGVDSGGAPVSYVVETGYVLLRYDGNDTGLCLTPGLRLGPLRNGTQEVTEDPDQWWVTHIMSGKRLGKQAYNLAVAHRLGSILAQQDWLREEYEISDHEISTTQNTIRLFDEALFEATQQGQQLSSTGQRSGIEPTASAGLAGELMVDPKGGIARVLEDNGDTLFMLDSMGQRYEIRRDQVRPPTPEDYRISRVAPSFEPAKKSETQCARCGRLSHSEGDNRRWYRMDEKSFCSGCAYDYSIEQDYCLEEDISSEVA